MLVNKPSLTILCGTDKPGRLVYNGLRHYKDIADEIILAADSKVGAEDLGWYAAAATKLLRFDFIGTDRHWPWLMHHVNTDWVFLVDGDELPSQELLDGLPRLMEDRDCDVWSIPIRWCYPGAETYLNQEPWRSHIGPRLRRNVVNSKWLSGKIHQNSVSTWPHSIDFDLPIYHLDLPSASYETRKKKVERYDRGRGGHMTFEGEPHNVAFYLPEDNLRSEPLLAPIAPIDASRIAEALSFDQPAPDPVDPESIPAAGEVEILKHHPERHMGKDNNAVEIKMLDWRCDNWIAGNTHHTLAIEIRNTSDLYWPGGQTSRTPVIYGEFAWEIQGNLISANKFMLDRPLKPGDRLHQLVNPLIPDYVGLATLIIRICSGGESFAQELRHQVEIQPSINQRLKELSQNKGIVSLEDAFAVRKSLSAINGITNNRMSLGKDQLPTEIEIVSLIEDISRGGIGVDSDTIDFIQSTIKREQPNNVIELDGVASAVVIAHTLKQIHGDSQLRFFSFQTDLEQADALLTALQNKGLDKIAAVIYSPGNDDDRGLNIEDQYLKAIAQRKPEFCVLRGHGYPHEHLRLEFFEQIKDLLASKATVLVDDAFSDAQLEMARILSPREDISLQGIWLTPKGLLQASYRRSS